jgi:S-DNA-T family DNA segregation ATPase FtsK/SpoIIIE
MAARKPVKPAAPAPGRAGRHRFRRYGLVLALTGVVVLAWLSLLTFSPTDAPGRRAHDVYPPKGRPDNAVGVVGAHVAHALRYWLGGAAYAALLLLTAACAIMLLGWRIGDLLWRLIGAITLVVAMAAALYLHDPAAGADMAETSSGVIGRAVGHFVLRRFSTAGSWVLVAISLGMGLMLSAGELVIGAVRGARRLGRARRAAAEAKAAAGNGRRAVALPARPKRRGWWLSRLLRRRRARPPADARAGEAPPAEDAAAQTPAPRPKLAPAKARRQAKLAPDRAPAAPSEAGAKADYPLPSIELLKRPDGRYSETAEVQAAHRRVLLQQTLDDFNVAAEVVGLETGPVITLFEVALSPGVKVSQIATLATDIARALAVPGVRIVPPRFGKDTVGIEVPNSDKELVRLRELVDLAPQAERRMALPLYLGKDAGGEPIIADLAEMPHLLIAGTTGSGKSVSINAIIVGTLMLRRPEHVRLILVDPKMVEMAAFERIPHLLCPIVNDVHKAGDILEWAATKMDERYELLKEAGVRNIAAYNRLDAQELHRRFGVHDEAEKARVPTRLPYYVIIIDELADLIMTAEKEVEGHIIRIAQKARAVGIHMILATQRPSVNVVTGLIKSNMPCRISFRVASRQESRIVLDQNGAEVLLGQGDMLFLQPGTSSLVRAQGTFVDEGELRDVVGALSALGEPEYHGELMRLTSRAPGEGPGERDELFDQAAEIVLASRRGSVSLLQRRLQIGYTRASRIIDQMADAGLLGEYKGSQARECLMTLEDWQTLQESVAADQSGQSAVNGEPTSV